AAHLRLVGQRHQAGEHVGRVGVPDDQRPPLDPPRRLRPGGPERQRDPGRGRAMRLLRALRRLLTGLSRDEGGWALATTITLTTLMVSGGLATAAWVDGQTKVSTRERVSES